MANLASDPPGKDSLSGMTGHGGHTHLACRWFSVDPNSVSEAYIAGTLTADPATQPQLCDLYLPFFIRG